MDPYRGMAEAIAATTARLRRIKRREPDLLELTRALIADDEIAEAAIIRSFWESSGAYPAVTVAEIVPGIGLTLDTEFCTWGARGMETGPILQAIRGTSRPGPHTSETEATQEEVKDHPSSDPILRRFARPV